MVREASQDDVAFVYFDLGNVLLSFDPAIACRNLAERFSMTVSQARSAVYESGLQDRFEHGQVSGEQFAESVRQQLGQSASAMPTAAILDAISDMFTPIESMRTVLNGVRDRGLPVGLLSNTCKAHWDWIQRQRYTVMDFEFDVTILSYEIGAMKPDAAIYDAAERAAGVPAERILFLDDREENVAAASRRGWQAAQAVGGEPSEVVLRAHRLIDQRS